MRKETTIVAAPKKGYAKPQLTTHGNVSELTQHFDDHRDRCDHGDEGGCASHLFDHRRSRC